MTGILGRWQTVQAIAESLDSLDLDQTLLTIRNALVETAGFDRAGILLVDESDVTYLLGTWGTSPEGNLKSEYGERTRTMKRGFAGAWRVCRSSPTTPVSAASG